LSSDKRWNGAQLYAEIQAGGYRGSAPLLRRFMTQLRKKQQAAGRAAFTSRWSNGQVEAQVNCLKLQKRLMFGRANFDLLRLHVLRRA